MSTNVFPLGTLADDYTVRQQFAAPEFVSIMYIQQYKRARARVWRTWKTDNPDLYAELRKRIEDLQKQVRDAKLEAIGKLLDETDDPKRKMAIAERQIEIERMDVDADAGAEQLWLKEYEVDIDTDMTLAVLDTILTPLPGKATSVRDAYASAMQQEVMDVVNFFWSNYGAKKPSETPSETDGSNSPTPPTTEESASPDSSRRNGSKGTKSSASRTATQSKSAPISA